MISFIQTKEKGWLPEWHFTYHIKTSKELNRYSCFVGNKNKNILRESWAFNNPAFVYTGE